MQKTCSNPWCREVFTVTDDDQKYYEKISPVWNGQQQLVPPPDLCPQCRQQRRLAWRNERNLYSRTCDLCQKRMVSVYPEHTLFPVYCVTCWWSNRWNAESYGMPYDPARGFLEQWKALHDRVPKLAMQNDDGIESENSEYSYDISRCKNCYRLIGSWYDQDCHYSMNVNRSRNIVDCNAVSNGSELVYESMDSQHLYHCGWLYNCENCHDCFFGMDLRGCSNCFCCYGLRQKSFCIFNEQLSEADYRSKMQTFPAGSYRATQETLKKFDAWNLRFPRLFANLQNCEDCEGNNLFNCKSVIGYSIFNSEHCKYVDRSDRPMFSYDIINTGGAQWCCDCVTPDDSYMTLFSIWCWKSKEILYSDNCHSSEHLLGCISMHRARHCILNKRYEKEEYESLAATVITSLRKEGVWGGLLPVSLSPFAYNESAAQEYFPLSKEETEKRGWRFTETLPYTTGKQTLQPETIPDAIADVPDSIAQEVLACQSCKKNYKITTQELAFYRQMPCPIPRRCPDCRHLDRFARKTPTRLWTRVCDKCGATMRTTFDPKRSEKIFCKECYLKEVY